MGLKSKIKNTIKLIKKKEYIPVVSSIYDKELLIGKTALITGGSSGIGLEIAKKFLECGCNVIISGTNETKIDKIIKEINNPKLKGIVLNVLNVSEMKSKIEEAAFLFDDKIDILVNSAGVVVQHTFFDIDEDEYDNIMNINAKGTFFMSKFVSELMIKKKIKGHILNVTSSSALRPAWTPYQMSKWAVRGFTMGLADTLIKYGIVVNAIAPGPTATPMLMKNEKDSIFEEKFPTKRYALPVEIANIAVLMVSDAGNMIIGDTFYVTGGSGTITYHN